MNQVVSFPPIVQVTNDIATAAQRTIFRYVQKVGPDWVCQPSPRAKSMFQLIIMGVERGFAQQYPTPSPRQQC
jgi:hypothetical protein